MAAVFVFGIRIFNNLATIRHYIVSGLLKRHNMHATIGAEHNLERTNTIQDAINSTLETDIKH
jgi:hypothetical protein